MSIKVMITKMNSLQRHFGIVLMFKQILQTTSWPGSYLQVEGLFYTKHFAMEVCYQQVTSSKDV